MPTILHEAVTPVAVQVVWSDVAQGIVNQIISAFNDVTPVVLTVLGVSIAFKTTIRMIRRFARI